MLFLSITSGTKHWSYLLWAPSSPICVIQRIWHIHRREEWSIRLHIDWLLHTSLRWWSMVSVSTVIKKLNSGRRKEVMEGSCLDKINKSSPYCKLYTLMGIFIENNGIIIYGHSPQEVTSCTSFCFEYIIVLLFLQHFRFIFNFCALKHSLRHIRFLSFI